MIAALALSSGLFLSAPDLQADSSELRFYPDKPIAGQQVRVEYRASSLLAGEERLVLRARYHSAGTVTAGPLRQLPVDTLVRQRDGTLAGVLLLPDSVVYAAFAVESVDAERVDSNGERLWELLSHNGDGIPTADALLQKIDDLQMRDSRRAAAAARQAATLYPENLRTALRLLFSELEEAGPAGEESVRQAYSARYQQAKQRLERSDPSAERIATFVFYANAMRDTATYTEWRERLIREHPLDRDAVQQRAFLAMEGPESGTFERLERLWEES